MSQYAKEILKELNAQNNKFIQLLHSGNAWQTDWTKLLKRIIIKIGEDKGFYVNAGGIEELDEGEWLFDLVWSDLKNNGSKTTITDIPLVLESEISKITFGGFKEDFDKLLFTPNSTKIFVTRTIGDDESILEECIKYAQESVNNNININSTNGVFLIIWQEKKGFRLEYISPTENFTDEVKKTIFEKTEKQKSLIYLKDIALFIMENLNPEIKSAFTNLNIDIKKLNEELTLIQNNDIKSKEFSNLSLRALKVFDTAPMEAKLLKQREISSFIILLCLLRLQQDNTTKVFNKNGVYYENMGFEFLKSKQ